MNFPLRVPFGSSGRVKSHSNMYFRLCASALVKYQSLAADLATHDRLSDEYSNILNDVEEAAVQPVVFAGMCLEATLYDLAAALFGEDYAEYTDKLDPIGKFVAIARLVDGTVPTAGNITLQSLKALVSARNGLVHYKSQSMLETDWQTIFNRARKNHKRHVEGISACFKALVLLSLHFDGNIFEETRILPSFIKAEYWVDQIPPELHEAVHWCIATSKKRRAEAQLEA